MPTQSLREAPPPSARPASSPRAMALRRFVVIGGAIVLTIVGAEEMYRVFAVNGADGAGGLHAGAVPRAVRLDRTVVHQRARRLLLAAGRRRAALGTGPDAPLPHLATRTALLMPTYNEQPARIMAGLQAIDESLREIGAGDAFDLFILSDTTDPEIWIAEEAGFLALRERTGGDARIFYRRRPKNTARKSGNIADWVRRFGGAYPQFLILDADSLMTGETLVRLVGAMERHPDVGLIQTLPIITGAHDAVRPHAAVRRPRLRPADRARHRLVARRGGQLLGPQRADPHARLRRTAPGCRNCAGASRSAATS